MRPSYRTATARQRLLDRVAARDGNRCFYCGCRFGTGKRFATLDHFTPLSVGGSSCLENLRAACARCNAAKADMPGAEFLTTRYVLRRRRAIELEQAVAAGEVPTKRMYHHPQLHWSGEWRWWCAACGQGGARPAESPARALCRTSPTNLDATTVLTLPANDADRSRP